MARRETVHVIERRHVDGGKSPNAYVPQITVEIRVAWPPHLGHGQEVIDLVAEVAYQARAEIAHRMERDDA